MNRGNAGKGRRKGSVNKFTKTAREAFQLAFDEIGGWPELAAWARDNRTEFNKLYARLIPVEHVGEGGEGPVQSVVKHIYETVNKP